MVRTFKLSLAAIVVLTAGAFASLAFGSGAEVQPVAAEKALPARAPVAPHAAAPVAAAPMPAPVAPAATPAPQPERQAFQNWSPSVAALPADLGEMGPSLKLGLDEARNNDMEFCFRDLQKSDSASTRATDFVLYLEARDGAVDVVDAKVARAGTLPSSVLECCRDVLRGLEVKVFFAEPGQRFSYIFEVEA
jgi:hypothetical protein